MNERQLQTLIEIAACGSFSKAEERLFCSKQALVKRISTLENEIGFLLFERGHQGVVLTEAGALFCTGAKRILDCQNEVLAECRKMLKQRNELRLSKIESHMLMDEITLKFAERFPGFPVRQVIYPGRNECERVQENIIDIGETPQITLNEDPQLEYTPLIELPYCCLLAKDHPLANCRQLSLGQLRSYAVVIDPRQYSEEHLLCLKQELPKLTVDCDASEKIQKAYALCQKGQIFITPAYYSRFLSDLAAVTLDIGWKREYGLVYHKDPSPAVLNYLQLAREIYSGKS